MLASFFWSALEAGGDRPALITERQSLSYASLVERIEQFAQGLRAQLPPALSRPLVLLEAVNEVGSIVAYLACLRAQWPVILVAEGKSSATSGLASTYGPNIVVRAANGWEASLASAEPVALNPELAVLLSTSGTTGAEKLVRLSASNLQANATSIASYLGISSADRAITTLPYHYSYGMSVLHTHFLSHAGVVLSPASLVDAEFWSLARQSGVTSLALVPTQFELLDKISFSKERQLPSLRYVTQAGGKLDPTRAWGFARQAKNQGYQFFMMYGQTESGPRMSYVPSEDVEQWHHSIGRAVDGGTFRLIDAAGEEITGHGVPGELVYEGPNVMLGYAHSRADLAKPAGPSVLKTGDIAERLDNGFYRITGRANRFIKLFGLRISLDEVESTSRAQGRGVYVSGSDERLVVFSLDAEACAPLRVEIARRYKWPERVVEVVPLESVPLLPSGKVDYRELSRRAASLAAPRADAHASLEALLRSLLYASSLDPNKSFLQLGGHSLAYLEVQLFLSQRLGTVPAGWESLPLRELYALEGDSSGGKPGWQRVPADLIARDAAILAVISLHSSGWSTGGGSILLLVLVGYSLARFQSERLFAGQVGKTLRSMLGRIVIAYYVFIAVAALKFSPFDRGWFFLVQNLPDKVNPASIGPYWFVSTYVQIIALACLPFLLPSVRAKAKRHPFGAGVAATLALAALIQLSPIGGIHYNIRHHHPVIALELLLVGWCMYFANNTQMKLGATALVLLVWLQNFGFIEANIAVLLLCGSLCTLGGVTVSLPVRVARGLALYGSLSLFVYLAHVPVLYGLSGHIPIGPVRFAGGVVLSFVCALGLKTVSDVLTRGKALTTWSPRHFAQVLGKYAGR